MTTTETINLKRPLSWLRLNYSSGYTAVTSTDGYWSIEQFPDQATWHVRYLLKQEWKVWSPNQLTLEDAQAAAEKGAYYDTCSMCGQFLTESLRGFAYDRFEKMTCSAICRMVLQKQQFACCQKAEYRDCGCAYSFDCAEHGVTHVGGHD